MATASPQPAAPGRSLPAARAPHPAGFFSRLEAFTIDLVILSVAQLVASVFIQKFFDFFTPLGLLDYLLTILKNSTYNLAIGGSLTALLVIGYFTFFWTLVGFTPGKAVLGLKVVRKNGAKVSFGRSLLRFLCYWVSAIPLFLGFLWVLWDPKRQGWHDKLSGTQVLYIPKNPSK